VPLSTLVRAKPISLALELGADRVIIDERAARRLAHDLTLPFVGVLGILLASKQKGLIPLVRPILDDLVKSRFRISPELYEWLLSETGEGAPPKQNRSCVSLVTRPDSTPWQCLSRAADAVIPHVGKGAVGGILPVSLEDGDGDGEIEVMTLPEDATLDGRDWAPPLPTWIGPVSRPSHAPVPDRP
jgi:uncharacterized protein DUF3368